MGGGIDLADNGADALQGRNRIDQTGVLRGWNDRRKRRAEDGGDLAVHEARYQHADASAGRNIKQRRRRQGQEASSERDAKHEDRERHQHEKVEKGERHIGQLLAKNELHSADRGYIEVDDRSEFLLANDAEGGKHRRDEYQQDRNDSW